MIYLRNRYYDSSTGRFITEDPAQDGLNWYSYCAGNPVTFKDTYGLWLDGDENLSQGAQTYTKYYGEQWEIANQKYLAATTDVERNKAQAEMDNYHALAEDIRVLDTSGLVQGKTLQVPLYNQYNTSTLFLPNNLCWATCSAMVASYQLKDTIDRTLSIAINAAESTKLVDYNVARTWYSTSSLGLGIKTGQEQFKGQLTEKEIKTTIDNGNPFGVLYGATYFNASIESDDWSGHWIVGIGYATAQGHDFLVVSNDPAGGIQRIQTYDDFKGNYVGDTNPWRPWKDTAL